MVLTPRRAHVLILTDKLCFIIVGAAQWVFITVMKTVAFVPFENFQSF
jgi:hypothetical protein